MSWRLLSKLSAVAVSSLGGVSCYYLINPGESKLKTVYNSWTTNYKPSVEWDHNWDHRATTSLVKPLPEKPTPAQENSHNEKMEKNRSKATRHIILIRHGQYNLNGATDKERILTELGRQQAKISGQRLAELQIPIDNFVISTMARAQETGKIILDQLPSKDKIQIEHNSLIEEGAPIPPEPKVGHWRPEPSVTLSLAFASSSNSMNSSFSSFTRTDLGSKQDSALNSIALILRRHQTATPLWYATPM